MHETVAEYLPALAPSINGSKLIVHARINENDHTEFTGFSSYMELLFTIQTRLLPMCNLCLGFEFNICFYSGDYIRSDVPNVIASILRMPVMKSSLHVKFEFDFACATILAWELDTNLNANGILLPIDAITDWLLGYKPDKRKKKKTADCQKRKEKFLQIKVRKIENGAQLCERLKKVFSHIQHYFVFNSE